MDHVTITSQEDVKVGLVLPGVSYCLCLCMNDVKQQFLLLIATLHLGDMHCIVDFE